MACLEESRLWSEAHFPKMCLLQIALLLCDECKWAVILHHPPFFYLVFSYASNTFCRNSHMTICQFDVFIPLPRSIKSWAAKAAKLPSLCFFLDYFITKISPQNWITHLTNDIAVTEPFLEVTLFYVQYYIYRISKLNAFSEDSCTHRCIVTVQKREREREKHLTTDWLHNLASWPTKGDQKIKNKKE